MNLYEWSSGRLALIDILPDGKPLVGEYENGAYLGRENSADVISAISSDGQRVVWSHGHASDPAGPERRPVAPLYVRDLSEKKTWRVGGPRPLFEMMSANGAWVFFWEKHELYAFNVDTQTTFDLTATRGGTESDAGVVDGFDMATSDDGSHVYYVAKGALAAGAASGEYNLYVSHYDGEHWDAPALVATLSKADITGWFHLRNSEYTVFPQLEWDADFARVSPGGRYLAFLSSRSLTGYDNTDVSERETEDEVGGSSEIEQKNEVVTTRVHHDMEVYLYDAVRAHVVCVSCKPTGSRPDGAYGSAIPSRATKGEQGKLWVAAWFPEGSGGGNKGNVAIAHMPRYITESGRVFFDSMDSLVPQDTNGVADVYEYEPAGVGDCTNPSATFSDRSGGCVSLVSSGTSARESALMDASGTGDDVFFATASKLVGEDYDSSYDVYDAHVCSAAAPCRVALASPPACTSGDSCKAAPSPQPEIFGPAPSATFSGVGNFSESAKPVIKQRSLTRAQKLSRALRACRKKRSKRKRAACERRVRKLYRVERKRAGRATSIGRAK